MLKIVLINPKIPPNTGNIARLCAANDFELHLVGELGFSLSDKHLKRAGLDYWKHVKLFQHADFNEYLKVEKERIGTDPRFFMFTKKAQFDLFDVKFEHGDTLVFGAEDYGIPCGLLVENFEHTVRIPMQTKNVRSLNLSGAVSIASYEAMRQIIK